MKDKQAIQQTLEEEARKCQWLVLWLDCDREGENIAFEVIEVCTGANSRLNIWRAHFSALIDREIHEAMQRLGRPNKLFADAVDARQEIDLRIGASFTRFQTMLLKDAFVIDVTGDDRNLVLSYVPCQFIPTTLMLDSGVTRPPPLLAEADLLSCMDKAGIGTDATMHDHIKKLLDRCYATKDENTRFSPTNLGEALVMGYDEMGYELWKPYLRSMMEADMKSVSMGTKSKSEVLESCLQQMKACFLDARVNKAKLLDAMGTFFARSSRPINETQNSIEVVRPCSACNESEMVLKRRPTGEFMVGCRSYPQCRNVVWLPGSLSEAAVTNQVCPTCAPGPVYKIQFKFRRRDIPPNFDVDHLGCVGGCDDILKELMEISRFGSRNQAATPARQTPNGARQGAPRQDLHTNFRPAGQLTNENPPVMHSQSFRSTHTQNSRNASDAGQVLCTSCGEPCISLTANTEANRGRKFYKCQNPGCGFFKWGDEMEAATPRGRRGCGSSRQVSASASAGRGGAQGRGRRGRGRNADGGGMFVSATGDPVSGCCFTCGDRTHFANACPNRRSYQPLAR